MDVIELYDGPAPGSEDWNQGEQRYFSEALDTEVITNVAVPTITSVLPAAGTGNGAALIIAPDGHGFGMRTQHLPSDTWIDRFLDWFDATDLDAG